MAASQWAEGMLGSLCLGATLPLALSSFREWRDCRELATIAAPAGAGAGGALQGSEQAQQQLRAMWLHRAVDIMYQLTIGLDAASTHAILWRLAAGDAVRVAAAQALAWVASAAGRALTTNWWKRAVASGWLAPRTIWAISRAMLAVSPLAALKCGSLSSWAWWHMAAWGLNPNSAAEQSGCWQRDVAKRDAAGSGAAARYAQNTGSWCGAAGFAAAWVGAKLLRGGRGGLSHRICVGVSLGQSALILLLLGRGAGDHAAGATSSTRPQQPRRALTAVARRRQQRRAAVAVVQQQRPLPPPPAEFSSLGLMLSHGGAPARRLALGSACMLLSQSVRVLADATCLGPLGWQPHELVVFGESDTKQPIQPTLLTALCHHLPGASMVTAARWLLRLPTRWYVQLGRQPDRVSPLQQPAPATLPRRRHRGAAHEHPPGTACCGRQPGCSGRGALRCPSGRRPAEGQLAG